MYFHHTQQHDTLATRPQEYEYLRERGLQPLVGSPLILAVDVASVVVRHLKLEGGGLTRSLKANTKPASALRDKSTPHGFSASGRIRNRLSVHRVDDEVATSIEHDLLVSGPDMESCSRHALSFFDKSQLVHYDSVEVSCGRSNRHQVEILSGVREGQYVVTKGAFDLKAKMVTSTLDPHAGHGH